MGVLFVIVVHTAYSCFRYEDILLDRLGVFLNRAPVDGGQDGVGGGESPIKSEQKSHSTHRSPFFS